MLLFFSPTACTGNNRQFWYKCDLLGSILFVDFFVFCLGFSFCCFGCWFEEISYLMASRLQLSFVYFPSNWMGKESDSFSILSYCILFYFAVRLFAFFGCHHRLFFFFVFFSSHDSSYCHTPVPACPGLFSKFIYSSNSVIPLFLAFIIQVTRDHRTIIWENCLEFFFEKVKNSCG